MIGNLLRNLVILKKVNTLRVHVIIINDTIYTTIHCIFI